MDCKTIIIVVRGILSGGNDGASFPGRACSWVNLNTHFKSYSFEYWAYALTHRWHQQRRAERLADGIRQYWAAGWRIVVIAHSNGGSIFMGALRLLCGGEHIEAVHMLAPACPADFESNGFNEALGDGRVGRIHVKTGGQDWALWAADWSAWLVSAVASAFGSVAVWWVDDWTDVAISAVVVGCWLLAAGAGWFGWGGRPLGRYGPQNCPYMDGPKPRVTWRHKPDFGHSDWQSLESGALGYLMLEVVADLKEK